MSLDIQLTHPKSTPGTAPKITTGDYAGLDGEDEFSDGEELWSANITHNLGRMARESGFYQELWRQEEIPIIKASQLIEPLRAGIARLKERPKYYKQFDAPNGWGTYEQFLPWLDELLSACATWPHADVHTCR